MLRDTARERGTSRGIPNDMADASRRVATTSNRRISEVMILSGASRCLYGDKFLSRGLTCYTDTMPDTSSHDATRPDDLHTMSARELEAKIAAAGIVMSYRQ